MTTNEKEVAVVRHSEMRILNDMEHSSRGSFIAMCRALKGSHFTRKRKMPLDKLMLTVLFRKGRTLIMELRSFKKILFLKDKILKTGYLKQRMKLNPEAFLELARFHASNFYKTGLGSIPIGVLRLQIS